MAENVSQFILRRLHEQWGVERIYGYPGDGINGLIGAFHDHVRIESLLFDGTLSPAGGRLVPDPDRPGLGIELKRRDAERYLVT